jgi:hypothetical protein
MPVSGAQLVHIHQQPFDFSAALGKILLARHLQFIVLLRLLAWRYCSPAAMQSIGITSSGGPA